MKKKIAAVGAVMLSGLIIFGCESQQKRLTQTPRLLLLRHRTNRIQKWLRK